MKDKKLEDMQDKLLQIIGNIMTQSVYGNKKAVKQLQAQRKKIDLEIEKHKEQ